MEDTELAEEMKQGASKKKQVERCMKLASWVYKKGDKKADVM